MGEGEGSHLQSERAAQRVPRRACPKQAEVGLPLLTNPLLALAQPVGKAAGGHYLVPKLEFKHRQVGLEARCDSLTCE